MMKRLKSLEAEDIAGFGKPCGLYMPDRLQTGTVFASAHSGAIYPASFVKRSALSLADLRRNEDTFVDALFRPVQALGAPLLAARFPRCFVDVNRAHDEVPDEWLPDFGPSTPRANLGLGVVPTIISEKREIYSRPLRPSVVEARLKALYRPYHTALKSLLSEAQDMFGSALLIDCHSMPGYSASGKRRSDIILGDRFGTSCHPDTLEQVKTAFKRQGYAVTLNHPYAGGYVTSHYGRPEQGIEAIQVEINRDLYLNPVNQTKNRDYDKLAADLTLITKEIIDGFGQRELIAAQ